MFTYPDGTVEGTPEELVDFFKRMGVETAEGLVEFYKRLYDGQEDELRLRSELEQLEAALEESRSIPPVIFCPHCGSPIRLHL